MAVNPNFTFADPALNAQAVAMIQAQAQAEAARNQQFAATLSEMRRQRTEQADKEERRAIREADIRRLDATEAERRRQFDEGLKQRREEVGIGSEERKSYASERAKEQAEIALHNNLLNAIEKTNNLMTVSELEARMGGLSEPRKQALRERRNQVFGGLLENYKTVQNEADYLSGLVNTKDDKGITRSLDSVYKGVQNRGLFRANKATGKIESLLKPPREDAPILAPGTSGTGATPIEDLLRRVRRPGIAGAGLTEAPLGPLAPRAADLDISGQPLSEFNMPFEGGFLNPMAQPQPWVPARVPFALPEPQY